MERKAILCCGPAGRHENGRRPRPSRPAGTCDDDPRGHDYGRVRNDRRGVDRKGQAPEIQSSIHRTDLPAHAGAARLPARQRFQNLHRLRRRNRIHACLCGQGLRDSSRAGDRQQHRNQVRDARGRAGAHPAAGIEFHGRQRRQARGDQYAHWTQAYRRVRQLGRRFADAAVDHRGRGISICAAGKSHGFQSRVCLPDINLGQAGCSPERSQDEGLDGRRHEAGLEENLPVRNVNAVPIFSRSKEEDCMSEPNPATAIDILLDPDATMIEHATAANARLLKVFPKGFALDASHAPHITTLMRYVRTADLDKVYAAASRIFSSSNVTRIKLKAFKYYFLTDKSIPGLGGAGIVVELNPELIKLQQDLIDAVAPFTVETGTAAAFATTPEEPDVNEATLNYVRVFVPEHSGKNYLPHVTVGLAPVDYLNAMLAETFDVFTFSPASASVYQLGNFGTARKQLKALDLKP